MDRSCGWVELVDVACRRRGPAGSAARLARVRLLLAEATGPGWTARLGEADGRWHVWISTRTGGTVGMLPFFKALGSAVPTACGVLDLPVPAGTSTRWVMMRGSVDLVRDPDRTQVG
jgi:hypothetical protein